MKLLFVIDSLGAEAAPSTRRRRCCRSCEIGVTTSPSPRCTTPVRRRGADQVRRFRRPTACAAGIYVSRVRELRREHPTLPRPMSCTARCSRLGHGGQGGWMAHRHLSSCRASSTRRTTTARWTSSATSACGSCVRCRPLDAATAHLVDHFHAVSEGVAEANIRALHVPRDASRSSNEAALARASGLERRHDVMRVRQRLGVAETPRSCSPSAVRSTRSARSTSSRRADRCSIEFRPHRVLDRRASPATRPPALRAGLADHPRAAPSRTLLGHRDDVPDLLCAADVLAIPSLYEGTAGAAIEAMALRCPVVCTSVTGVGGILDDGDNALLVPTSDPYAFADRLRDTLTDEHCANLLRENGLRRFDQRFNAQRSASELIKLYEQLRGGAASGAALCS